MKRHLTLFSETSIDLNLHFGLSTTKYEIFPKLESQKLAISKGHFKSESPKPSHLTNRTDTHLPEFSDFSVFLLTSRLVEPICLLMSGVAEAEAHLPNTLK